MGAGMPPASGRALDDQGAAGAARSDPARSSLVRTRGLRVDPASLIAVRDPFWSSVVLDDVAALRTNGNGACSVHAVLGTPAAGRELLHPDARGWIGSVLSRVDLFSCCVLGFPFLLVEGI